MSDLLRRITLLSAFIICAAATCAAQQQSQKQDSSAVEADETFTLNIAERRITEQDFAASTSVGFDRRDANGVSMQIGVALRAQRIDVTLRNVTGTVRFRGSVQRILDLINSRPSRPPR